MRGRHSKRKARQVIAGIVQDLRNGATDPEVRQVYQHASEALLRRIQQEFEVKANGGVDSANIYWEVTEARRRTGEQMMIKTRRLFESLSVELTDDGLRIFADSRVAPYAAHALEHRPAWPRNGNIPQIWWDELTTSLINGLTRIIKCGS